MIGNVKSQSLAEGQRAFPFDPGRHPAPSGRLFLEGLPMSCSRTLDCHRRELAGSILHIDRQCRATFGLESGRRRDVAEVRDPFDNNGCAEPRVFQSVKSEVTCNEVKFLG